MVEALQLEAIYLNSAHASRFADNDLCQRCLRVYVVGEICGKFMKVSDRECGQMMLGES